MEINNRKYAKTDHSNEGNSVRTKFYSPRWKEYGLDKKQKTKESQMELKTRK